MTATAAYPTKTLANAALGTLVIEPLTPKHKKLAFDALRKRGIKVLPSELDSPSIEIGIEFAISTIQSWKKPDGSEATAVEKREFFDQYDSLRETILSRANKLNDEWNADVELEEKNS